MKSEIKVPPLGESVSEASISAILKANGTKVRVDEEIVELETDKVNQVLHSPVDGVLTLNVNLDDTVQIGQVIGFVDPGGKVIQDTSVPPKEEVTVSTAQPLPKPAPQKPVAKAPAPAVEPAPASPQTSTGGARKMKGDFLKELSRPPASAPAAAPVQAQEKAPAKKLPEPHPLAVLPPDPQSRAETPKRMSKIRKVIAKRLVQAQNTTAMLTTFNEVDMTAVIDLRKRYKDDFEKRHGIKLGFMSFFVKACVSALQEIPGINSYIKDDQIIEREYYDIGIAVSSPKGLLVPVVRNCEHLSLAMIETAIAHYATKARSGTLSVDELQGGGFTITNGGIFGSLLSTPILNPPQSGILGMHKIQERPMAVDGKVEIRPMMYLALSYDHRIVDGKEAVSFLVHVKNMLEDPTRFLLDV